MWLKDFMKLTNIFWKTKKEKNLNPEDIFNDIKFATNKQENGKTWRYKWCI